MSVVPERRFAAPRRDEWRGQVRAASDIVEVVAESGVELRRVGQEHVGRCPFHDDQNPSLNVNHEKQVYRCHACGAGGDVFSFVMQRDEISFRAAAELLSQRAGIPIPGRNGNGPQATQRSRKEGRRESSIPSDTPATVQPSRSGLTLAEYAETKGLPEDFLRKIGLADISYLELLTE